MVIVCLIVAGSILAPVAAQAGSDHEWKKIKGNWYLYSDGDVCKGWYQEGGKWYYLSDKDGRMFNNEWLINGPRRYYFKSSGAMAVGWHKINKTWYYFDSRGHALNGWVTIGGKYYYMQDYKMVTGWHKINGFWYNFSVNGEWMKDMKR